MSQRSEDRNNLVYIMDEVKKRVFDIVSKETEFRSLTQMCREKGEKPKFVWDFLREKRNVSNVSLAVLLRVARIIDTDLSEILIDIKL